MICPKCNKAVPDGSVFCNHCGKKLIKEKRTGDRANGTGSVYYDQRSKRWIAQIVTSRHYTSDMKLRFSYKRKSYKTKTEALKAVSSLEQMKERPAFTLSYYYNAFMKGKGNSLSEGKQRRYKVAYKRLKPLWGRRMDEITINDLQSIVSASCDSYDPAKDIRTLLNHAYRLAAADDRNINHTLPSLIVLPKQNDSHVEPFSEDEQLKLWISYENGNENAAIPLILIYTGMMPGEMRQLRKSMINLDAKEISGAGLKTEERKKKAILLPDDIIPVLEDVMSKAEDDLLYPIVRETFYIWYYNALAEAGIERHLTPYSCRHTTATVLAVHENIAPQVLQRIMRWKSTKMMDRYVNPSDMDARKAVNKI